MDVRRVVAAGSLALVAALVVGLVATRGDDAPDAATGSPPPAPAADATSAPTGSPPAADATGDVEPAAPTTIADPSDDALVPDLPVQGLHKPLPGLDGWLQSDVTSLEELRGKVVAVQFWTFGCFNCKNTMPHMRELYDKYVGDDFEIVGVHAPEFDFEKDPERIAEAAAEQGIVWPIALDTEKTSFRTWQTERRFWPRIYLIDRDGNVRYDKIGEGKYDEIDAAVAALIAEQPSDAEAEADATALPANVWPEDG